MCNPRRIKVEATRRINQAWDREVARVCELTEVVIGEARACEPLDATVGGPALRALEQVLGVDPEWQQVENGYRRDVTGGYVLYRTDTRGLEIVAELEDVVEVAGEHREVVRGEVAAELNVEGEGVYYSDGWGGTSEETATRAAEADAEGKLDEATRQATRQAAEAAEEEVAVEVEQTARRQAEEKLRQERERRRAELAEKARERIEGVGVRARQAFNQVLARAYQDAILAYARSRGATGIQCNEDGNSVEIEFSITA